MRKRGRSRYFGKIFYRSFLTPFRIQPAPIPSVVQILKSPLLAYEASRPIQDGANAQSFCSTWAILPPRPAKGARRRAQVAVKTGCTSRRRLGLDDHEHGGKMGKCRGYQGVGGELIVWRLGRRIPATSEPSWTWRRGRHPNGPRPAVRGSVARRSVAR